MKILHQRLEEAYAESDLAAKQFLSGERKRLRILGDVAAADRVFVCNELGGLYREQSLFAQAVDCLQEALSLLEDMPAGKESMQYATVLLNLAGVYRAKGSYDKALDLYTQSRSIMEDLGHTSSYEYASALNNLSLLLQKTGDYQDAYRSGKEACALAERLCPDEAETGISYSNLASLALKMDDTDLAEEYANKALKVFQMNDSTRGHFPAVLNQLAAVKFKRGDYDEAEKLFLQALELTERNFGKNIDYAQALNNLSEVYKATGKEAQAQEALDRAAVVLEQCK